MLLVSLAVIESPSLLFTVFATTFGPITFVFFIGRGLTLLRDALRPVVLSIDVSGFRDHLSGMTVAWRDVSAAQYHYGLGAIACLALTLKERTPPWQNPFRLGYRHRRGDQLIVPMALLVPDDWTLAFIFETLIEAAGGEVSGKPPNRPIVRPLDTLNRSPDAS